MVKCLTDQIQLRPQPAGALGGAAFLIVRVLTETSKRDIIVGFDRRVNVGTPFRSAVSSLSALKIDYDLPVVKLTEITDERINSFETGLQLVVGLVFCSGEQVVKPDSFHGCTLFLREEILCTFTGWLEKKYETWQSGTSESWCPFIERELYPLLRAFGLSLMWIHEKGYFFGGSIRDLLLTRDGLKIWLVRPNVGAERDRQSRILHDVQIFTTCFFHAIAYALPNFNEVRRRSNTIGFHVLREKEICELGLSDETCDTLRHFELAEDLETLPAKCFLNHPLFSSTKDKMLLCNKINTTFLYQFKFDRVTTSINRQLKIEGMNWKWRLSNRHVCCVLIYTHVKRGQPWSRYNPFKDPHIFTDYCRIFPNSVQHIDKNAIHLPTDEDVFEYVEKALPGSITKIYGYLLTEIRRELLQDSITARRREFLVQFF